MPPPRSIVEKRKKQPTDGERSRQSSDLMRNSAICRVMRPWDITVIDRLRTLQERLMDRVYETPKAEAG
jgi:hypothetical protein